MTGFPPSVASTPQPRKAGWALVAISLFAIGAATLTPQATASSQPHYCLICGSFGTVDALLNVLLFLPLGIGLALTGTRARVSILSMLLLSIAIESTQLVAIAGRDATIGDVVFNTLGGAAGFAIGFARQSLFKPSGRAAARLAVCWAACWLLIQAIANIALRTSQPDTAYFGQFGHILGGFSVFHGVVRSARVAGLPIVDGRLADSRSVRHALLAGDSLVAGLVVAGSPRTIAPIVRIADQNREEILLLGQQSDDLVFAVRTIATDLRLRPAFFSLRHAFEASADGATRDSVMVVSNYLSGRVVLRARNDFKDSSSSLTATAASGWILFLPFQWLIEGTRAEQLLGLLWMFCLLIPLGFWAARSAASSSGIPAIRRPVWAAACVGILLVGLLILPLLIGTSPPGGVDWVGSLLGIAGGAAIAARS
ncbi:MAG TPA: VanZ family protein [Gemmatimonadaceae bacterium]|nr:VanZ family protein [Gemmatimonadaceae bacterium]